MKQCQHCKKLLSIQEASLLSGDNVNCLTCTWNLHVYKDVPRSKPIRHQTEEPKKGP